MAEQLEPSSSGPSSSVLRSERMKRFEMGKEKQREKIKRLREENKKEDEFEMKKIKRLTQRKKQRKKFKKRKGDESESSEWLQMEMSESSESSELEKLQTEMSESSKLHDFNIPHLRSEEDHKSPYKDQHLFSYPYLEKYIDENGGELHHKQSGTKLIIPEGALSKGYVLSMTIMRDPPFTTPAQQNGSPTNRITPIVKCGPTGLKFKKEVKLIIPYYSCLKEDDKDDFGAFHGEKKEGKDISWTDATVLDVAVKEKHCCLSIMHFTYFVCTKPNMEGKIIQAMPFARRMRGNSIKMLLWMCRSDGTSMQEIRKEEEQHSSVELQSWQDYIIYDNGKDVGIEFMKKKQAIPFNKMWHGSRTMRNFRITDTDKLQASGEDLSIQQRGNKDKIIFTVQFSVNGRPLTSLVPSDIAESAGFIELKRQIHDHLITLKCIEFATYFNLGQAVVERIEKGPPADVYASERLLDELTKRNLFGPNTIQPLLEACTDRNEGRVASMILKYRQGNEAVEAICAVPVPSDLKEN